MHIQFRYIQFSGCQIRGSPPPKKIYKKCRGFLVSQGAFQGITIIHIIDNLLLSFRVENQGISNLKLDFLFIFPEQNIEFSDVLPPSSCSITSRNYNAILMALPVHQIFNCQPLLLSILIFLNLSTLKFLSVINQSIKH